MLLNNFYLLFMLWYLYFQTCFVFTAHPRSTPPLPDSLESTCHTNILTITHVSITAAPLPNPSPSQGSPQAPQCMLGKILILKNIEKLFFKTVFDKTINQTDSLFRPK